MHRPARSSSWVARDLDMLTLHTNSETVRSAPIPTAPAMRSALAGRAFTPALSAAPWHQGRKAKTYEVDDHIAGLCLRPRHHLQYMSYAGYFKPDVEIIGEAWPSYSSRTTPRFSPESFEPNPTLYSCLGRRCTRFIDQGNITRCRQVETFAVNMAITPP